jgi:hypothetical protein
MGASATTPAKAGVRTVPQGTFINATFVAHTSHAAYKCGFAADQTPAFAGVVCGCYGRGANIA